MRGVEKIGSDVQLRNFACSSVHLKLISPLRSNKFTELHFSLPQISICRSTLICETSCFFMCYLHSSLYLVDGLRVVNSFCSHVSNGSPINFQLCIVNQAGWSRFVILLTAYQFTFVAGICGKNAEGLKETELEFVYFCSVFDRPS